MSCEKKLLITDGYGSFAVVSETTFANIKAAEEDGIVYHFNGLLPGICTDSQGEVYKRCVACKDSNWQISSLSLREYLPWA